MLKQNDDIRETVNANVWHNAGYTGKGITIVLLDNEGMARNNMKSYYTDVLGDQTEIGHASNVGQVAHEFAPDAQIKMFSATHDFDKALEWIKANKPDLINVSLAGVNGKETPEYLQYQALGIPLICASGNDDYEGRISYPAAYPFTIAVGAYNPILKDVASYSNEGAELDCVAPSGVYIQRDDGYTWDVTGTSFAAPSLCGMLACYIQWRNEHGLPKIQPEEVRQFIHDNCKDIDDKGFDTKSGYGLFCLPGTIPSVEPIIINGDEIMDGIDCASTLNATSAQALKNAGIEAVGRYISGNYGMTATEAKAILDAGLKLWLIFELNPTYSGYFYYAKGVSDAQQAAAEAETLGAPEGIGIFFAVDFDAQSGDMAEIIAYFEGVRAGLQGKFKVGAYGSFAVLKALNASNFAPDFYYQTYAWSDYQFPNPSIYQYQNSVQIAGISVDKDYVYDESCLWSKEEEEITLDHAVMYFTVNDFSIAKVVADKLGGCAMFCRNADNANIHKDAKSAKHLVAIGGAEVTDHSNVTNCCGLDAPETAILAAQYAQTL